MGNYKKSIFITNVYVYKCYNRIKEHIIIRIAIYKIRCIYSPYCEFPVRSFITNFLCKRGKVHTKVGNKGWKAEKRSDWQKKYSKPSKKLTAFSLHVNDGKRLVTRGSRDDPERKRIMTPAYLRNVHVRYNPSWCATERLPILMRGAISPPSANRGIARESHGCNRQVLNYL